MESTQPVNVTGNFGDLFVGTHISYGKVALKRPRASPQDYTHDEIRVRR